MNDNYIKKILGFYARDKKFKELCDYYYLDNKKIIKEFQNILLKGIYSSGSWKGPVVQNMLCCDKLEDNHE